MYPVKNIIVDLTNRVIGGEDIFVINRDVKTGRRFTGKHDFPLHSPVEAVFLLEETLF